MKKAKSDPSKPQTRANEGEARDRSELEALCSDGERQTEGEAAGPVKAEPKGKRTKGAGQRKTAAPATEGSAMNTIDIQFF